MHCDSGCFKYFYVRLWIMGMYNVRKNSRVFWTSVQVFSGVLCFLWWLFFPSTFLWLCNRRAVLEDVIGFKTSSDQFFDLTEPDIPPSRAAVGWLRLSGRSDFQGSFAGREEFLHTHDSRDSACLVWGECFSLDPCFVCVPRRLYASGFFGFNGSGGGALTSE